MSPGGSERGAAPGGPMLLGRGRSSSEGRLTLSSVCEQSSVADQDMRCDSSVGVCVLCVSVCARVCACACARVYTCVSVCVYTCVHVCPCVHVQENRSGRSPFPFAR